MGCFGNDVRCPKCGHEFDVVDGKKAQLEHHIKKLDKWIEKEKDEKSNG